MIKKVLIDLVMIILLLLLYTSVFAHSDTDTQFQTLYYWDVSFVQPAPWKRVDGFIVEGEKYISLRDAAFLMHCSVNWDDETKTITIHRMSDNSRYFVSDVLCIDGCQYLYFGIDTFSVFSEYDNLGYKSEYFKTVNRPNSFENSIEMLNGVIGNRDIYREFYYDLRKNLFIMAVSNGEQENISAGILAGQQCDKFYTLAENGEIREHIKYVAQSLADYTNVSCNECVSKKIIFNTNDKQIKMKAKGYCIDGYNYIKFDEFAKYFDYEIGEKEIQFAMSDRGNALYCSILIAGTPDIFPREYKNYSRSAYKVFDIVDREEGVLGTVDYYMSL